jgi:hypothetical protein
MRISQARINLSALCHARAGLTVVQLASIFALCSSCICIEKFSICGGHVAHGVQAWWVSGWHKSLFLCGISGKSRGCNFWIPQMKYA